MDTEASPPHSSGDPARASGIRWPPPGLERLQGDLGRVAARAALGGGVLVLPLLFVIARDLDFATLGPFADAWWVTLVLAVAGLAFALDALMRTVTMLRRASQALEQGYELSTVAAVLADGSRDAGFLLTGARHFSVLDAREREAIGAIRVFAASMYALAGIWLLHAFAVGLLLGARGVVSPAALWMLTLLPSVALYAFGAVATAVAQSRVRRARRRWHGQAWSDDLASDEAAQWRASFASLAVGPDGPRSALGVPRAVRWTAIAMGIGALLVALPILTLVPTSAVGPILTTLAVPGFGTVRERAARAEALRSYALPANPDLTPAEAGQLLHIMSFVGSDRDPHPAEREPARRIAEPWLPETDSLNPTGLDPFSWSDSLMYVAAAGLTAAQREFLGSLAAHPARSDFSRLSRASAVDVASARFVDPLPADITLATMPLTRLGGVRMGALTHLGTAALELANGRPVRAEELISEVISVGFLLGDGGPTLIDNAVGHGLVDLGARALAGLYEVTEQDAEATVLRDLRDAAERAMALARSDVPPGVEGWVRSLPTMVNDPSLGRGLRWEYFVGIATLTPCLNLHRMVFGPDQAYRDFVDGAHESLVAWPSEEGLFEISRAGWFGSRSTETTLVGRLLGVSMRRGESACGEIVRSLETAQAVF